MRGLAISTGKWARSGLAALGLAALAVPAASALAVAEDPTQVAPAELTPEQIEQSRATFNSFSCGACHSLADAGASGQIGPALDGSGDVSHDFLVSRITQGQGAMPGFGGQIPDDEIDQLATYIMQVKK